MESSTAHMVRPLDTRLSCSMYIFVHVYGEVRFQTRVGVCRLSELLSVDCRSMHECTVSLARGHGCDHADDLPTYQLQGPPSSWSCLVPLPERSFLTSTDSWPLLLGRAAARHFACRHCDRGLQPTNCRRLTTGSCRMRRCRRLSTMYCRQAFHSPEASCRSGIARSHTCVFVHLLHTKLSSRGTGEQCLHMAVTV